MPAGRSPDPASPAAPQQRPRVVRPIDEAWRRYPIDWAWRMRPAPEPRRSDPRVWRLLAPESPSVAGAAVMAGTAVSPPLIGSATPPPAVAESRTTMAVEARNRSRRTPGIASSPVAAPRSGDHKAIAGGMIIPNRVIFADQKSCFDLHYVRSADLSLRATAILDPIKRFLAAVAPRPRLTRPRRFLRALACRPSASSLR